MPDQSQRNSEEGEGFKRLDPQLKSEQLSGLVEKKTSGRVDLVSDDFYLVQTLVNKPFDLGVQFVSNTLSSNWSSLTQISDLEMAHKHTWINADTDANLRHSVKHFMGVFASSPQ